MKKFIFILYSIFLVLFAIYSYAFVDPNLSYLKSIYYGFVFSNRFLATVLYILFILIFFIFYGIFAWLGVRKKLQFNDALLLLGITLGTLFISYPAMLSYDIFNYVATSKVLFFYSENPYIIMPIEFTGDPLLSFTHAANKIALYGPFWIVLTGIPYFLGFGNFIIALFSFKFFVAIFYLATAFLIWKMSKNTISVILFSLNPLIAIETLISGHNDIVMMFLALFSFFLLMRKKIVFSIVFFLLSIAIKYATLFLLPLFVFLLWKSFRKKSINWEKTFYISFLFMLLAFLLSPLREEIYPWYAIWFLPFVSLLHKNKLFIFLVLAFSFGLLLRYIPFMLLGTHFGLTPIAKILVTFLPVIFIAVVVVTQRFIHE